MGLTTVLKWMIAYNSYYKCMSDFIIFRISLQSFLFGSYLTSKLSCWNPLKIMWLYNGAKKEIRKFLISQHKHNATVSIKAEISNELALSLTLNKIEFFLLKLNDPKPNHLVYWMQSVAPFNFRFFFLFLFLVPINSFNWQDISMMWSVL